MSINFEFGWIRKQSYVRLGVGTLHHVLSPVVEHVLCEGIVLNNKLLPPALHFWLFFCPLINAQILEILEKWRSFHRENGSGVAIFCDYDITARW
jgi:hypothetical protein